MNETNQLDGEPSVSSATSDYRIPVPDTSMLPDSEKAAPAAVGLMKQAVQGAHDTIDRLADGAAPAVRQLGESVSAAEDALHMKAEQLRETRDEWVESVRTTVRGNPLVAIAAAATLGALVARITR